MSEAFRDPARPIDERTADLLGRMSLDEKLAQLGSIWSFELVGAGHLDRARLTERLADGIGQVTRLAGGTNLGPRQVAELANGIQRFLVEETRLGIPAIVHEESLHGLMARDATCFPQSIGAAASFDAELVETVAGSIRRRMLATGARHALAPVLDIARDPRWGRIEETYGEDPYLSAALSCAYVRGIQGGDLAAGVLATGKHMVGHGMAEGGLNQAPVHLGPREMRDEQLLAFEAAVVEAGLGSVMPAYCEVDGVPCHASHELLTAILRDEWGFDGIVVSDYVGIELLATQHRLTGDLASAASMALRAGVDVELPRTAAYGDPLRVALERGAIDERHVDAATGRVLRAKFRLGLFDAPYVEPPSAEVLGAMVADERRIARELAARSLVLVENDGVLPLGPEVRSLAVVGPIADSARDLIGDYSHLVHIETLLEMRNEESAFAFPISDDFESTDELAGAPTILDAIRRRLPEVQITHARGCGIEDGTDAELVDAARVAAQADAVLVVVGERSGLTDDATTGEFRDRREPRLSGRQEELVAAVAATGTPAVLLVVSGRPLVLEAPATRCAAVLLAWVPGDGGPDAIAAALAGDESPGGKLPVTMLRHAGQIPLTYRHHPSGGRSHVKGDYVDGPVAPLWPFGHGRSYTSFELDDLRTDAATVSTAGGGLAVSVALTNVGDRPGDEVVQLYARDEEALVARPVRELIGFRRVRLSPGERRRLTFRLHAEQFAHHGLDGRRIIEPGRVTLSVGTSSADLPLVAGIELIGRTVDLPRRRRFLTRASVD